MAFLFYRAEISYYYTSEQKLQVKVSVIIPVYNAGQYIADAVASALMQTQTGEVLLIDDGSGDDSLAVCHGLHASDTRIRILQHPGNVNLGVSASRNLGIEKATCDFIAFLDADDVYLPERFAHAGKIFAQHPDADGIHETIGAFYEDPALRAQHVDRTYRENTGLTKLVPPDHLFAALASGRNGHFSLDGFTIKRGALSEGLIFDTTLKQCEDSDFLLRVSRLRTIYSGRIDVPVALRRVHDENTVHDEQQRIYFQRAWLLKCIRNRFYGSLQRKANAHIVARYVQWWQGGALRKLGVFSRPAIIMATALYLIAHPRILMVLLFPKPSNT